MPKKVKILLKIGGLLLIPALMTLLCLSDPRVRFWQDFLVFFLPGYLILALFFLGFRSLTKVRHVRFVFPIFLGLITLCLAAYSLTGDLHGCDPATDPGCMDEDPSGAFALIGGILTVLSAFLAWGIDAIITKTAG
jgi:hypothetical protein